MWYTCDIRLAYSLDAHSCFSENICLFTHAHNHLRMPTHAQMAGKGSCDRNGNPVNQTKWPLAGITNELKWYLALFICNEFRLVKSLSHHFGFTGFILFWCRFIYPGIWSLETLCDFLVAWKGFRYTVALVTSEPSDGIVVRCKWRYWF